MVKFVQDAADTARIRYPQMTDTMVIAFIREVAADVFDKMDVSDAPLSVPLVSAQREYEVTDEVAWFSLVEFVGFDGVARTLDWTSMSELDAKITGQFTSPNLADPLFVYARSIANPGDTGSTFVVGTWPVWQGTVVGGLPKLNLLYTRNMEHAAMDDPLPVHVRSIEVYSTGLEFYYSRSRRRNDMRDNQETYKQAMNKAVATHKNVSDQDGFQIVPSFMTEGRTV